VFVKRIILLALSLSLLNSLVFAQSEGINYEELNKKLFGHIETAAIQVRNIRKNGAMLVGSIGLVSMLGGAFLANGPYSEFDLVKTAGLAFMATGFVYSGISFFVLLIPSKEERKLAVIQSDVISNTKEGTQYLENALESLASRRKTDRFIVGALLLSGGLAEALLYSPSGSVYLFGMGLLACFVESPVELEWKAYQQEMIGLKGDYF